MSAATPAILGFVASTHEPVAPSRFVDWERIFTPEYPADSAPAEPWQTPERKLLAAVLEQALSIVRGEQSGFPAYMHDRLKAEELGWIKSVDRRGVMSFENVCAVLGIDADAVRGKVSEWVIAGAPKRRDHRRPVGNGQVRIVPRRA